MEEEKVERVGEVVLRLVNAALLVVVGVVAALAAVVLVGVLAVVLYVFV